MPNDGSGHPSTPVPTRSSGDPVSDWHSGPAGAPKTFDRRRSRVRPHELFWAWQLEQARRPPALAAEHIEQLSAAGAMGAADRTQSGPEHRVRTTVIATLAAAQNGTSGRAHLER